VSGTAITPLGIVASDSGADTLTYSANGTLPPGLAIDHTTGSITGTPTTAGSYPVTVTATDTDGFSGAVTFTWTVQNTVTVTNPGAQTVVSGTAITPLGIVASDSGADTLTYSANGTLPPGLAIDHTTGAITGTPTTAGVYSTTITATDTDGFTGTATFAWTIQNTVTVTNPGAQSNQSGTAITPLTIGATDSGADAVTYSAGGTLPPGLAIDHTSGVITGTPTTSGVYPVTITATDGDGYSGSASFSWTIHNAVSVTNPGAQTSVSGTAITPLGIVASDSGAETLTYADGGSLPPGLAIDHATGAITGTPTTAGAYPVTITVTDTDAVSGAATFTWTVHNTVTVANPGAQSGTVGTAITTLSNSASDSSAHATITSWSATGLPAGLAIDSGTGKVTGTPTATCTCSVTVTATDSTGATGSATFTWTIAPSAGAPTVTRVQRSSGPTSGGARVRITGTHLTGATQVLFGTVPGTRLHWNKKGTKLVVFTPAEPAGVVDVTVKTPSGTSVLSLSDRYTFVGPAVTKVEPKKGPAAGGQRVLIHGTHLQGATAVTFGSAPATFTVNGAGTTVTATSPAGSPGTVDVVVTSPGGVSAVNPGDQYTYTS
jgi:hypothetical protein